MDEFSKSESVVLALTNRYDGIDIPSDQCQLLVMYGLPTGTNLQESFLEDKLDWMYYLEKESRLE